MFFREWISTRSEDVAQRLLETGGVFRFGMGTLPLGDYKLWVRSYSETLGSVWSERFDFTYSGRG
jgi:hypothetical protein